MIKVRNLAALLALSSVAVLPACSMFGDENSRSSRASYPSQSYAAAPSASELTPDTTQQVQQKLQQQGLYTGRVDGVWGPATEGAVRSYQQQHNLNATGKLDPDTIAALDMATNPNAGQNTGSAQPPASQRYGSNYNPPPNNSIAPNNNPPSANASPPNAANTR
jgi:peptidoglycan hydrolase-like protein with peptidoglycan-binding domain